MDKRLGAWNVELVRGLVATAVERWAAEMVSATDRACTATQPASAHALFPSPSPHQVVSFDAGGVSGHVNHVAVAAGVAAYASHHAAVPCYALDTVWMARKFISALGRTAVVAVVDCGHADGVASASAGYACRCWADGGVHAGTR